ncbi:unnamed protein product [Cyprideis torosa]|uniref:Uncharacterized protein n=1 Tax=Cyprideis torosa TaxID=163714 RepID=A0A7R8WSC9_9CRUS|nr:unnamed protein product [Cyprideis torosa]CAG0904694.1 unnamed protein product [Cyprideis torosa]
MAMPTCRSFPTMLRAVIAVFTLTLLLGGCGGAKPLDDNASAEDLFRAAKQQLDKESYSRAADLYRQLLSRYPYGLYAQQGQIDLTYALYKDGSYSAAEVEADRFINLYPSHPYVDYLFYLKGLAAFHEDDSFWGRLAGRDDLSHRDPKSAKASFDAFRELVSRFPDSTYAADARERMAYLRSTMARHELNIANYYRGREAWVAVANRAAKVVETYPNTAEVEEALALQMEAYNQLQLLDLANDAYRVLEANFPDSRYLASQR